MIYGWSLLNWKLISKNILKYFHDLISKLIRYLNNIIGWKVNIFIEIISKHVQVQNIIKI